LTYNPSKRYLRVLGLAPEHVGAGLADLSFSDGVRQRLEDRPANAGNDTNITESNKEFQVYIGQGHQILSRTSERGQLERERLTPQPPRKANTYTLIRKSGMMAIAGMRNMPNQKTAVVNSIKYIPDMTLPTGTVGQNMLYAIMNTNQSTIEPQMAQCVNHVHELVTRPAFRQTVMTTY
jgi:hypothetical protein